MPTQTNPTAPSTAHLKEALFEDRWHRQLFIDEWILSEEPSHDMPWEREEQLPDVGAVLVRVDNEEASFGNLRIAAEALFIDALELESRTERAAEWAREAAARDICPLVLSYRLTDDCADFEHLALVDVIPPSASLESSGRFAYDGVAYPLPFSRVIGLNAGGEYELLGSYGRDADGEEWLEVRNLASDERLFLTGTLLLTATEAS